MKILWNDTVLDDFHISDAHPGSESDFSGVDITSVPFAIIHDQTNKRWKSATASRTKIIIMNKFLKIIPSIEKLS